MNEGAGTPRLAGHQAPPETRMEDNRVEEIRLSKDRATLFVTFSGGPAQPIAAELLRVESPSAEVQGHGPGQKKLVPGKQHVTIVGLEPVGHYAIRITFSDGHDTGYFTWAYLAQLARNAPALMGTYLQNLAARGLARG